MHPVDDPRPVISRAVPAVHHTWVAQQGDCARLARTVTAARLKRLAPLMIAVVVVAAIAAVMGVGGLFVVVYAVVVVAGIPVLLLRVTRTGLRPSIFAGATWVSGFGPETMMVSSPTATMVVAYTTMATPRRHGQVVMLPARNNSYAAIVVPAALCPPAALEFLMTRIAESR